MIKLYPVPDNEPEHRWCVEFQFDSLEYEKAFFATYARALAYIDTWLTMKTQLD